MPALWQGFPSTELVCDALHGASPNPEGVANFKSIEVTFSREGRAGTRMISVSTLTEHTVSTVSSVRDQGSRPASKQLQPRNDDRDNKYRPDSCSIEQASVTAADDADGADANAAFCGG
jgi:hypothetical protein